MAKGGTYCDLLRSLQIMASLHEGLGQSPPVSVVCGSSTIEAIFLSQTVPRDYDTQCGVD